MSGRERSQTPLAWLVYDERIFNHIRVDLAVVKAGLPAIEFAVYCGIVAHAEVQRAVAHPSAETLGSYFQVSERRVRQAIDHLERIGLLRVDKRKGKSSEFRLLSPPATLEPPAGVEACTSCRGESNPGTSCRGGRHHVPGTPEPRSDEQERALDKSALVAQVDELRAQLRVVR